MQAGSNSIVERRLSLAAAKKKDQLSRRLSLRPTTEDLASRNILKGFWAHVGPEPVPEVDVNDSSDSLVDGNSFQSRAIALKSCLKRRPTKQQLADVNILKGVITHTAIAEAQEKLRRSQLEDNLASQLRDRPSPQEPEISRILMFSETVEVLPTFRKSEYNRKPDNGATFRNLTPALKGQIREELNSFKKSEMPVHEDSDNVLT